MNSDSQLDVLIKNMARQHQADLPSPGLIWWRAQIQKKLAERERIERPMVIMRGVAFAVCMAVVVGFVVVNWRHVAPDIVKERPEFLLMFGVLAAALFFVAGSLLFRESAGKG